MASTPPIITDLWYGTSGPRDAKIVVVAESWGNSEAYAKAPLVGHSGQEFDRMLLEAKIEPSGVFKTNVMAAQPEGNEAWRFFEEATKGKETYRGLHPTKWVLHELDRLYSQIKAIKPSIVIAVGNYSLWALTSGLCSFDRASTGTGASVIVPTGITSWRGSMLLSQTITGLPNLKVLPIIHPASILRQWSQRAVTVHDLSSRVPSALAGDWQPSPPPTIFAPPSFEQAERTLGNWLIHAASGNVLRLSHDIETARGVITCMGFADGPYAPGATALVIPLVRPNPTDRSFSSFWSFEEEFRLTRLFLQLLRHPNVRVEGQNYNYDTQWIERDYLTTPNLSFDTMLAHHLLWPGTPKALDYISSLYNRYYRYWKDDNKEWDLRGNWTEHLIYNGEDCLRTYECATVLRKEITNQGFEGLWELEKQKNSLALEMMRRGVFIDKSKRAEMAFELQNERGKIYRWLEKIIPQSFVAPFLKTSKSKWWESTAQQKLLFYDILGLSGQTNRKTGRPTLDAEALETLKRKNPEFTRLWDALSMSRSISVFFNTFISAELEADGRLKCSYNTAGTETFRWSSSENAFWRGTNLQNIPKGEEKE